MPKFWTSRRFSLSNPQSSNPEDLPLLLERVAAAIRDYKLTADELADIIISSEETDQGLRSWTVTVYWDPTESGTPRQPLRAVDQAVSDGSASG